MSTNTRIAKQGNAELSMLLTRTLLIHSARVPRSCYLLLQACLFVCFGSVLIHERSKTIVDLACATLTRSLTPPRPA